MVESAFTIRASLHVQLCAQFRWEGLAPGEHLKAGEKVLKRESIAVQRILGLQD